jgi:hypothetical protein
MSNLDVNLTQPGQLKRLLKLLESSYPDVAVSVQLYYHLRSRSSGYNVPDRRFRRWQRKEPRRAKPSTARR